MHDCRDQDGGNRRSRGHPDVVRSSSLSTMQDGFNIVVVFSRVSFVRCWWCWGLKCTCTVPRITRLPTAYVPNSAFPTDLNNVFACLDATTTAVFLLACENSCRPCLAVKPFHLNSNHPAALTTTALHTSHLSWRVASRLRVSYSAPSH